MPRQKSYGKQTEIWKHQTNYQTTCNTIKSLENLPKSSNFHRDHTMTCYEIIWYPMKSEHSISYDISYDIWPDINICRCCLRYRTRYRIKNVDNGWQEALFYTISKIFYSISYKSIRYRARYREPKRVFLERPLISGPIS